MRRRRARNRRAQFARPFGLVLAVACVTLLATPLPAQAHARLVSSSPPQGARLDVLPARVSFTFDEPVSKPAFVSVIAPDGSSINTGNPALLDATVSQDIDPVVQKGIYTMSFRVVSDDSHPVSGTVKFRLTKGEAVEQVDPAPLPSTDDGAEGGIGSSAILIITGVVALFIVLAVVIIVSGRTRREPSEP